MQPRETLCTDARARSAASAVVMITSLFALDGCQVIKDIFGVGFALGAVLVVAVVAIIGGGIAVVTRK